MNNRINTEEVSRLIDLWIFSERDRAMAKRRFIDGIKFESLAEEFDMSVRQTKRIIYAARQILLSQNPALDI